jgi:hypothetical protein
MTPSNLLILLGIAILLWLPPAAAAADEFATPADLAELQSREQKIRAKIADRLRASVAAAIEEEGQALSLHMTERLWQDGSPPPAKRAFTDDRGASPVQRAGNTSCTRVGQTLECVLRDSTTR